MGSATSQARAASVSALAGAPVVLDTARELFAVSRVVGRTPALAGALADATSDPQARTALVRSAFASLSETTRSLLTTAVGQRWSHADDLVAGIEELAIRSAVKADPADVEGELFQVSRIVSQNADLELALGSRLGDDDQKSTLIRSLLDGRASSGTILVVSSLVADPRGRRVRGLLAAAMRVAADERGRAVATVTTAAPLTSTQHERLVAALSAKYGRDVTLNSVIDPEVLGGIRIQIADDVIDGSVSTRLADLRQRLAG